MNSSLDLAIDIKDSIVLYNESDYIAIVKVNKIEGSSNYNNLTESTVYPYTYGKMTVLKTLKGELEENKTIKFYKLGGTLKLDDYYNNLSETEKNKFNQNKPNNATYVKFNIEDDIDIEENKIYLVYLNARNVYDNEEDSYGIFGLAGGLREIKEYKSNLDDILVLNNFTKEYDKLSSLIEK